MAFEDSRLQKSKETIDKCNRKSFQDPGPKKVCNIAEIKNNWNPNGNQNSSINLKMPENKNIPKSMWNKKCRTKPQNINNGAEPDSPGF